MGKETSKAMKRRLQDFRFVTRFFTGSGLDIGCCGDSLEQYREFLPLVTEIRGWDRPDGDAQKLATIDSKTLDFVYSSHCLEHLQDPFDGIRNWLRVLKPGGYLVFTVPDEDLYEQGIFPSTFNRDHKKTFTIFKPRSWSPASVNIFALIRHLRGTAEVIKIELVDGWNRTTPKRRDQTRGPVAESAIEVILRKREPKDPRLGLQAEQR